ncbi:unnamed protein product [Camellia sinensis]
MYNCIDKYTERDLIENLERENCESGGEVGLVGRENLEEEEKEEEADLSMEAEAV